MLSENIAFEYWRRDCVQSDIANFVGQSTVPISGDRQRTTPRTGGSQRWDQLVGRLTRLVVVGFR